MLLLKLLLGGGLEKLARGEVEYMDSQAPGLKRLLQNASSAVQRRGGGPRLSVQSFEEADHGENKWLGQLPKN